METEVKTSVLVSEVELKLSNVTTHTGTNRSSLYQFDMPPGPP
jgi:hypothetical protein